ncbi:hypothetical protein BGZ95_004207, partial [Linnemannia exigua]
MLPLFMQPNHFAAFGASAAPIDRLPPQSVPDRNHYQNWNTAGSPFMPGSPSVLIQPASATPTTTPPRTPRVTHPPPMQVSPNVDSEGLKGECLDPLRFAALPGTVLDVCVGSTHVEIDTVAIDMPAHPSSEALPPLSQLTTQEVSLSEEAMEALCKKMAGTFSREFDNTNKTSKATGLDDAEIQTGYQNKDSSSMEGKSPGNTPPSSATDSIGTSFLNPTNVTDGAAVDSNITKIIAQAKLGDIQHQIKLAQAYKRGSNGLSQNYKTAMNWFLRAAEQENPSAQYYIGRFYAHGFGVPKDSSIGSAWYLKAAIQGHGVQHDFAIAAKWHKKAAVQGHTNAQLAVGSKYKLSQGVPQDYALAMEWYLKAAGQGSIDALYHIGSMYQYGEGVPVDEEKATEWYDKSAKITDA